MNYQLCPMDRSHLSQIAALEKRCFSSPWSEALLSQALDNENASYIVAQSEDGTVLGYAGMQVILDEGYVDNIAVHPDYRRQGVAEALLGVFERFGAVHLAFLTLEVRPSNTAAVSLYEKHGFELVGRRKNYYTNPREDALLMTRTFRETAVYD
ncbi:MAG: ribosomal protein S18-alanine N-acetyltransferase [Oscillospiraceae bacterium]|nr:ribosomal protein S18-alanine N-acetyltransferase [Oscillospiraceae bacterium]